MKNLKLSASRIDFAFVTMGIVNAITYIEYSPGYKTDHSLLTLKIQINDNLHGPGYRKFNNKMLYDKAFVDQCNLIIERCYSKYIDAPNPAEKWELCKNELIRMAKALSKINAKCKKEKLVRLNDKLKEVNENIYTGTGESMYAMKESIEMQIQNIIEKETKAGAFRAKYKYVKEGGKNTRYFLSLEKQNYIKKTMLTLKDHKGKLISFLKEILREQKEFYGELYKSNSKIKFDLENNSGKLIKEEDKVDMETHISLEELTRVVRDLKHNKSPGGDALTAEFYQFFWSKIQTMYHEAIVFC